MPVLNNSIFNLTYSGGMDVPELRLNLGGKRIGPQKIAELARWGSFREWRGLVKNRCSTEQARRRPLRVWRGLVKNHRSTEQARRWSFRVR